MNEQFACNLPNRQYIQIDSNFILQEIGSEIAKFADGSESLKLGQDARLGFPELIGLEETLGTLECGPKAQLILEGLSRFQGEETPFYFDIRISRREDNPDYYWICFEDSTQRTLNKQAILHHANASEILIRKLSASKQYIDTIIQSMAEVLIVTDNVGHIKSLNPAAISFLEQFSETLIGKPITQILPIKNATCTINREEAIEVICESKTGTKQYLAFTCTPLQYELEAEQGFIYMGRNITPRKQAEISLKQANTNLQQHNQNLNQLIEFSKVLNQCRNRQEVDQAISVFLPNFFHNWTGYLELKDAFQEEIGHTLVAWGDSARLENSLVAIASAEKPSDPILDRVEEDEILSIPLINQDQVLGKLHLRPGANLPYGATQKQLAIALAEQITLAIVNVTLRETLEAESIRDALTHLYNRRYLSKTLPEALNLAQQQQQSLCVVMLDVDHFKHFNDTWGHQAGDRVLEIVGSYLAQNIRKNDIAYRYGGEEFAIVLQNIEVAIAYHRIEQLRQGLRNLPIIESDRHLHITVSCGIASFPQNGQTASQLVQAADRALYQAKAQGRDRTVCAIPES